MRAVIAGMLVIALGLAGLAPIALGDGDPASDVLLTQPAFFAAQTQGMLPSQRELLSVLSAAQRAHFPIRVAIISSEYDLGAITALWQRPRVYAQYLGIELSETHNQRLLVVMPNGFGFDWHGHPDGSAYGLLAHVSIGPGAAGLATAARTAVLSLARANGTPLQLGTTTRSTPRSAGGEATIWLIIAITLAAIAAAAGVEPASAANFPDSCRRPLFGHARRRPGVSKPRRRSAGAGRSPAAAGAVLLALRS